MEENEKKEIGKAEKKEETIGTLTEGKTFVSDSFGNLRTAVDIYGRPVFCLKDACAILEIKNPSDASKRLRKSGVVRLKANDGKKSNSFLYITEGNLYRLIFQSRKEEAMQFVDWVTDTVLPEIRRYGRYEVKTLVSSEEAALAFLDSYEDLKTRVCISQQVTYLSQLGYFTARENIRAIIHAQEVQTILESYPYGELPLRHKVFFLLMKYRKYDLLIMLFKLKK